MRGQSGQTLLRDRPPTLLTGLLDLFLLPSTVLVALPQSSCHYLNYTDTRHLATLRCYSTPLSLILLQAPIARGRRLLSSDTPKERMKLSHFFSVASKHSLSSRTSILFAACSSVDQAYPETAPSRVMAALRQMRLLRGIHLYEFSSASPSLLRPTYFPETDFLSIPLSSGHLECHYQLCK